ncbi:MAG TPA: hypothetical protein PK359_00220 [Burkholderiaceae bacterium]|jgi:hypothetical protein|nr:hypothetical protein [Burkholderiaceae bacterium]
MNPKQPRASADVPPRQDSGADPSGEASTDRANRRGADPHPPGRPGPLVINTPAGEAGPSLTPDEDPDLRLPHEHDQSPRDNVAHSPNPVVKQAAKDLEAGQVDTDLRNIPTQDGDRRKALLKPDR